MRRLRRPACPPVLPSSVESQHAEWASCAHINHRITQHGKRAPVTGEQADVGADVSGDAGTTGAGQTTAPPAGAVLGTLAPLGAFWRPCGGTMLGLSSP